MKPLAFVFVIAAASSAASSAAWAQEPPKAEDRAAIEACLKREADRPERCIGIVYQPCTDRPAEPNDAFPPGSTPGQERCAARERAVWQAMIDASLKALREGPAGQSPVQPYNRPPQTRLTHPVSGATLIDDMETAWETWRAKACDIEGLRYEGGTVARTIYATCSNRETARHALWLKAVEND